MCMCSCDGSYCSKCIGIKTAVIGALIIINIYWWPKWTNSVTEWILFFAVLAVIAGVVRAVKPTCGCESHTSTPVAKTARK